MTIFLCSLVFFVLGFFTGMVLCIKKAKMVSLIVLQKVYEEKLHEVSKMLRDCDNSNLAERANLEMAQKSIIDALNIITIVVDRFENKKEDKNSLTF